MIKEVSRDKVEAIFRKHFNSYKNSDDPFEKFVIYEKDDIIGGISYSIIYERAEINYIVVLDNYRKKGIGTKLLEYALADILKNGCKVVSLEVSVDNEAAINLYLKNDFQIKSIREKYYEGNDGYLMVKELEVER